MLAILINGVDYISQLKHETLYISQLANRLNSTCYFELNVRGVVQENAWTVGTTRVEDGDVITGHTAFESTKVDVKITDGATTYFGGVLSKVTTKPKGAINVRATVDPSEQIIECRCHDYSSILQECIVGGWAAYANKTDEFIIDDIFDKYVNSVPYPNAGIDRDAHVVGGAYTFDNISFQDMTVREFMDKLVAHTGYTWYIDYDKNLHYSAAGDAAAAWYLSDAPDYITSFSYLDPIKTTTDATNLINRVLVMGEALGEWYQDDVSIASYGVHQKIVRDASLLTQDDLDIRGDTFIAKFKDPLTTYNLRTYKDGLRAGMQVQFVCAHLDITDTFLVQELKIKFPVDGEPIYNLKLGNIVDLPLGIPFVPTILPPAQPRLWTHDLAFAGVDLDTVEWSAGTVSTTDGLELAIIAGDTGNMPAGIHMLYVYVDLNVSVTTLQTSLEPLDTLGYDKFLVARCWRGWVMAGFEVLGGGKELASQIASINIPDRIILGDNIGLTEVTGDEIAALTIDTGHLVAESVTTAKIKALTILAGDIAANAIIASKIDVANLAAVSANIGILTIEAAGEIRAYTDTWDVDADGFRITHDEICGQEDGDDQVIITAADGKLRAGAGAVVLDKNGIKTIGAGAAGNARKLRFIDDSAGEEVLGGVYGEWGGGAGQAVTWIVSQRIAGDPWPAGNNVTLAAFDQITGEDVRLSVNSNKTVDVTGEDIFMVSNLLRPGLVANAAGEVALASVEDGCLIYREDTHKLRLRANSAWVDLN